MSATHIYPEFYLLPTQNTQEKTWANTLLIETQASYVKHRKVKGLPAVPSYLPVLPVLKAFLIWGMRKQFMKQILHSSLESVSCINCYFKPYLTYEAGLLKDTLCLLILFLIVNADPFRNEVQINDNLNKLNEVCRINSFSIWLPGAWFCISASHSGFPPRSFSYVFCSKWKCDL